MESADTTRVLLETPQGMIVVSLYDGTPLHRDNFLKLVREGFYDGLLFHRVIRDFMIQGGDPLSRGAGSGVSLGTGGPGYTVPAEIDASRYFHKRGVLAAARQGDEVNPEKASSGSQFYIVWGTVYNDGKLDALEKQLTQAAERRLFDASAARRRSEIVRLRKAGDREGLYALQEELLEETRREMLERGPVLLSAAQREAYRTAGGTPHLDGDYTVFGEVVEGLDVVERIVSAPTGRGDRPTEDITMRMRLL